MNDFDVIILGGGTAGCSAAESAAKQGATVGLVECGRIGGHSLLRGQLPLQIAYDWQKRSGEKISFAHLLEEVELQSVIIAKKTEDRLKDSGVELIRGTGFLKDPGKVSIRLPEKDIDLECGKIIIATGSQPHSNSALPFDEHRLLPIDLFMKMKKLPVSILIIGGDKAALEGAQLFNMLGCKVFLVDENTRLVHDLDSSLIEALEKEFKKLKIKVLLGKKIISIFKSPGMIDVTLDGDVKFSTEKILVSAERHGNTSGLGLDSLKIDCGNRREIWINEQMETSRKGIFAAGSVTGRSRSIQISEEEGRVAGINAAGERQSIQRSQIPFYLQTTTPIASIGCLFGKAHFEGYRAVEGRYDVDPGDTTDSSFPEFCKIVVDRDTSRIIGAQVSGRNAYEVISIIQTKMREGGLLKDLAHFNGSRAAHLKPIIQAAKACAQALSVRR
ncbi:MAG: NAD(P)/FAD-dependent oxidoreductase [Nitrospinota bacterium]|nr:NAD(P)/FAD-dependent oxidoreductase [Nitrospinota bacterium]